MGWFTWILIVPMTFLMSFLADLAGGTSVFTGFASGMLILYVAFEIMNRRFHWNRDGRDLLPPATWGRLGNLSLFVLVFCTVAGIALFTKVIVLDFWAAAILGALTVGSFSLASMSTGYRRPLPANSTRQDGDSENIRT